MSQGIFAQGENALAPPVIMPLGMVGAERV
jgi:hypothetical protein